MQPDRSVRSPDQTNSSPDRHAPLHPDPGALSPCQGHEAEGDEVPSPFGCPVAVAVKPHAGKPAVLRNAALYEADSPQDSLAEALPAGDLLQFLRREAPGVFPVEEGEEVAARSAEKPADVMLFRLFRLLEPRLPNDQVPCPFLDQAPPGESCPGSGLQRHLPHASLKAEGGAVLFRNQPVAELPPVVPEAQRPVPPGEEHAEEDLPLPSEGVEERFKLPVPPFAVGFVKASARHPVGGQAGRGFEFPDQVRVRGFFFLFHHDSAMRGQMFQCYPLPRNRVRPSAFSTDGSACRRALRRRPSSG